MATVSFHLKEPNGDKPTAIFIWFNPQNGQPRVRIYTGDKIHPDQWEGGDIQRAKTPKRGTDTERNKTINTSNERMSKRLLDYWAECRAAGTLPTNEQLRAVVEPQAPTVEVAQPQPLIDFAAYLERMAAKNAVNTVKSHRTTYNHLVNFVSATRKPLEYKDFTRAWKNQFCTWLADGAGGDKPMADSSINKQLKNLKAFLHDAADHGLLERINTKRGWGWDFTESEPMALSAAELTLLEAMEGIPPYLENARRLWLLMAYTGLRYSDAIDLKPEHDKGDTIQLIPRKTTDVSAKVYVPKAARTLLAMCWSGEIHNIANSTLNEYIKEVCCRAGINEPTEKMTSYAQTSRPLKTVHPKYELVTCHTARRTFITHSFARKMPLELIMMSAAHTNPKTTLRYNQNTVARQIEVSRQAWGEDE